MGNEKTMPELIEEIEANQQRVYNAGFYAGQGGGGSNGGIYVQGSAYITPQMYGAKGDGVTDDTQAFVSALESAVDVIYVPAGCYAISSLTIGNNKKIIGAGTCGYREESIDHGEGGTCLRQIAGSNSTFITLHKAHNTVFKDITIDGNSKNNKVTENDTDMAGLLISGDNRYLHVENIEVCNCANDGFANRGGGGNWLTFFNNISAHSCERYSFYDTSTDNRYVNLHIAAGKAAGMYLEGVGSNIYNTLKIDGQSGENFDNIDDVKGGAGLILTGCNNVMLSNVDIQSNKYVGCKIHNSYYIQLFAQMDSNGGFEKDKSGCGLYLFGTAGNISGMVHFAENIGSLSKPGGQEKNIIIGPECGEINLTVNSLNAKRVENNSFGDYTYKKDNTQYLFNGLLKSLEQGASSNFIELNKQGFVPDATVLLLSKDFPADLEEEKWEDRAFNQGFSIQGESVCVDDNGAIVLPKGTETGIESESAYNCNIEGDTTINFVFERISEEPDDVNYVEILKCTNEEGRCGWEVTSYPMGVLFGAYGDSTGVDLFYGYPSGAASTCAANWNEITCATWVIKINEKLKKAKITVYRNGVKTHSHIVNMADGEWMFNNRLSFCGNPYYDVKIHSFAKYDRALSEDEVRQNCEALMQQIDRNGD